MIDSFPFDEWSEEITTFWTFGPENSTGTYVLTVLGIILMVAAIIYWVWLENRKLTTQAELLRGAGGLPPASPTAPGPGFEEPPLAGPSTDPGP
ncbi:MAG: hypothetical protein ACRDLZ_06845 [Gaiellaceae bacterium]